MKIRGSQMRGRVQIHDAKGRLIQDSGWGPWQLATTNWGRLLQGVFDPGTLGSVATRSLVEVNGTTQTCNFHGATGSFANFWLATTDGATTYPRLGWGNGADTPSRADTDVSGRQDLFNVSSQALDETAGTLTLSGSKSWTGATTEVTRIGLYIHGKNNTTTTPYTFLMDHSSVNSVAVTSGQTVTVTYEIAY